MPQTTLKRIAHPTDLARDSEFAFYHALRLAVAARSRLDILHVEKDVLAVTPEDYPSVSRTLQRWELPSDALGPGDNGDRVRTITAYGTEPFQPLLDYLDESMPDLMVLATHRRHGFDRWLHKEIAQRLARRRAMLTLFVPYGDEGFISPTMGEVEMHRVLLPVDWIPCPQAAVDAVAELADLLGCASLELTLLHVGEGSEDFPHVTLPERDGWTWERRTRSGEVVETILAAAAEESVADLIVMVTEGREGFLDALRGSTTEQVLRGAPCPLLAVPARDTKV